MILFSRIARLPWEGRGGVLRSEHFGIPGVAPPSTWLASSAKPRAGEASTGLVGREREEAHRTASRCTGLAKLCTSGLWRTWVLKMSENKMALAGAGQQGTDTGALKTQNSWRKLELHRCLGWQVLSKAEHAPQCHPRIPWNKIKS